jgi:hypothetical protein
VAPIVPQGDLAVFGGNDIDADQQGALRTGLKADVELGEDIQRIVVSVAIGW